MSVFNNSCWAVTINLAITSHDRLEALFFICEHLVAFMYVCMYVCVYEIGVVARITAVHHITLCFFRCYTISLLLYFFTRFTLHYALWQWVSQSVSYSVAQTIWRLASKRVVAQPLTMSATSDVQSFDHTPWVDLLRLIVMRKCWNCKIVSVLTLELSTKRKFATRNRNRALKNKKQKQKHIYRHLFVQILHSLRA